MATKTRLLNSAAAVRGFYDADSVYHQLEPGESVEAPMNEAVRKTLGDHWLFGDEADAAAQVADDVDNADADGLPETKAELEALAAKEGIDLSTIEGTGANGGVVKADIAKAIADKRAAPAGGVPPRVDGPNDDLDNMSDDDLRGTVKVLTGEDAPEDATREQLLALARGEQQGGE